MSEWLLQLVSLYFSAFLYIFSAPLVSGNSFTQSGIYLSFTNVKSLLSHHCCFNSAGMWQAIAPWACQRNVQMHSREAGTHARTHTNTPVNIYHVLVCHQLSPPPIASISFPSLLPPFMHPLPPQPAPPTQCCGLPVTVIEVCWSEQCENWDGRGGKDGRERNEKRKEGRGKPFIWGFWMRNGVLQV